MRNKRVLALLFVVMLVPSVGLGARGFFKWWLQPPADPILNVEFAEVNTRREVYVEIKVSDSGVDSWERTQFNEAILSATVDSAGELTFSPATTEDETSPPVLPPPEPPEEEPASFFEISNDDGATISFAFPAAELEPSFFGSYFRVKGTATVTPATPAPEEGPEEPDVAAVAAEVPVITVTMAGSIYERKGKYRLRARIFGYLRTEVEGEVEGETTDITYNIVRLGLKGSTEVPPEPPAETEVPTEPEVPEPADPPTL